MEVVLEDADARCRHHQRSLGGIADRAIHLRLALVALQQGVVAEGSGDQQEVEVRLQPRVLGRGVGDRETEPGALGPLRELHPAGGHVEGRDRHAVLGQRPGLVRADHLDRPKSLDGRQPADEGAPLEHALRAQRERDRDHGGQGLRNGGHGQADRNEHHFPPGLTPHHAEHEDHHDEHQRGRGQLPTELVQALLQWRRLLL